MNTNQKSLGKRILIVDDHEEILTFVRSILESEGYIVDTAVSGSNALPILVDNRYDLIISDINMPYIDGEGLLDVCNKKFKGSPVILMTGKPDYSHAVKLIKKGAFDYIVKPFSCDEMINKVHEAISESEKQTLAIS
jgi:DNA-binding NtrC family response regulator